MTIEFHPAFKKSYQKRIAGRPKLIAKVAKRMNLFQQSPYDPLLRNHALTGKKLHLRAFSITGDMRIVYFPVSTNYVLFLDIGTHNQIY